MVAGLGYLALKPKADVPAKVEQTTLAPIKEAEVKLALIKDTAQSSAPITATATTQPTAVEPEEKPAPTPVDQTTQESLTDTLRADKELAKVADVNLVECLDGKCTVELEAKGDENVQMKMLSFMAQHREEYGRYSKFYESEEYPRITRFIISKEELH